MRCSKACPAASPVRSRCARRKSRTSSSCRRRTTRFVRGGPTTLKAVPPEHLVVIADALSKSVVLARDEREVSAVFELVEPFARQLAEKGRTTGGRRAILKHIGNALLVHPRVSGRVAVAEKPDVGWDRYDLERPYA